MSFWAHALLGEFHKKKAPIWTPIDDTPVIGTPKIVIPLDLCSKNLSNHSLWLYFDKDENQLLRKLPKRNPNFQVKRVGLQAQTRQGPIEDSPTKL